MNHQEAIYLLNAAKTYIDARLDAMISEERMDLIAFENHFMRDYNGGMALDQKTFREFLRRIKLIEDRGIRTVTFDAQTQTYTIVLLDGTEFEIEAPVQEQSDWSESDTNKPSYIKHKPTIPTVNNPTITLTQGGVTKGSFSLNQASGDTIGFDAGENPSNKVTSLSAQSTDTQYPSAKCVYGIVGDIETLLASI